jgi:hypothetical protein
LAATASIEDTADALLRLAHRFEAVTWQHATPPRLIQKISAQRSADQSASMSNPGEPARDGLYEEVDAAGDRTGVITSVENGLRLPGAPRGFRWQPLATRPSAELLAQAAENRRVAATGVTMGTADKLITLAERLEARARKTE